MATPGRFPKLEIVTLVGEIAAFSFPEKNVGLFLASAKPSVVSQLRRSILGMVLLSLYQFPPFSSSPGPGNAETIVTAAVPAFLVPRKKVPVREKS